MGEGKKKQPLCYSPVILENVQKPQQKRSKVLKRKCREPDLEKRLPSADPVPMHSSVFWDTLSSETQAPKMLSPLGQRSI